MDRRRIEKGWMKGLNLSFIRFLSISYLKVLKSTSVLHQLAKFDMDAKTQNLWSITLFEGWMLNLVRSRMKGCFSNTTTTATVNRGDNYIWKDVRGNWRWNKVIANAYYSLLPSYYITSWSFWSFKIFNMHWKLLCVPTHSLFNCNQFNINTSSSPKGC